MDTLRGRLTISHLLPILVIIPMMGIALVYLLETQVLLSNLSNEVTGQAVLIATLGQDYPSIWTDPAQAQSFVDRFGQVSGARLMIMKMDGQVLASNDPADQALLGKVMAMPGMDSVLNGQPYARLTQAKDGVTDVLDVIAPVKNRSGQTIGIVHLSHPLVAVSQRFQRLRYLIAVVVIGGLVMGIGLALVLTLDLEQHLRRATEVVLQLAGGGEPGAPPKKDQLMLPLQEQGPRELRQLSNAVNTLVQRLNTLESSRRQLLANLVHELGRPLGALASAIQAVQRGADQDVELRHDLLQGMEEEVRRLQRLLEDLSRLYDEVLGTLEISLRPVDLKTWLPSVLVTWREEAQSKRLDWENCVPDDLPTIQIDPDRLAQALGNLVSNAIKYTPAGGKVMVSAGTASAAPVETLASLKLPASSSALKAFDPDCPQVWIQVADDGPGIMKQEQELIFNPFYRGFSTTRFPQGMGLGLSIARDLVQAHNGRLVLDSEPGKGSKFTIWLPMQ